MGNVITVHKGNTSMIIKCPQISSDCPLFLESCNTIKASSSLSTIIDAGEKMVINASDSKEYFESFINLLWKVLLQLDNKSHLYHVIIGLLKKVHLIDESHYENYVYAFIIDILEESDGFESFGLLQIILEHKYLLWNFSSKEESYFIPKFLSLILHKLQTLRKQKSSHDLEKNVGNPKLRMILSDLTCLIQKECDLMYYEETKCIWHEILLFTLALTYSDDISLELSLSSGIFCVHLLLISDECLSSLFKKIINRLTPFDICSTKGDISIFHGILCYYSSPSACFTLKDDCHIFHSIFRVVIDSINHCETGVVIVMSCRVLNQLLALLCKWINDSTENIPIIKELFGLNSLEMRTFVDYVWIIWEHYLDSVRHLTKSTFCFFIKLQTVLDKDKAEIYFKNLSQQLLEALPLKKCAYCALSCLLPVVGASNLLEMKPDLLDLLLPTLNDNAYASYAKDFLCALFKQHYLEISEEEWQRIWILPFFKHFHKDMLAYGYEDLFKVLLQTSSNGIKGAIQLLDDFEGYQKDINFILCTKISVDLSVVAFPNSDYWRGLVPYSVLQHWLNSFDEGLRFFAFGLLCKSPKSTELFNKEELNLIQDFIENNINSKSPSYRQQFISVLKKMFLRINNGMLLKKKRKDELLINVHQEFLKHVFYYTLSNLHPNASFPRCSTSIQIIELMCDIVLSPTGCFNFAIPELYNDETIDTLICNLSNSFENNKVILLKLLTSILAVNQLDDFKVNSLLKGSWRLTSSCKPSDTITASYIFSTIVGTCMNNFVSDKGLLIAMSGNSSILTAVLSLVSKLEEEVKCAQNCILKASSSAPMYGLLLSLRNLLNRVSFKELCINKIIWSRVVQFIIKICFIISEIVSPIIKHDAPEGQLSTKLAINENQLKEMVECSFIAQEIVVKQLNFEKESEVVKVRGICAQMLLLCGWRSVKELSLLLATLVKRFPLEIDEVSVISINDIIAIKNLFFDLLLETKHRGAFEQIYVGCKALFEVLWCSEDARLNTLPASSLNALFTELMGEKCSKRLCFTRRSGGIPFFVQAILSTEPSHRGNELFYKAMQSLSSMSETSVSNEVILHRYNIERSIFREAKLGKVVLKYVTESLAFVLRGYLNDSWPVRNAATLLFSSLHQRIFGVKKNQDDFHRKNTISAVTFFERHPNLRFLLSNRLQHSVDFMHEGKPSPELYPILLILSKLSPVSYENRCSSAELGSEFIPLIIQCKSSPVFQVRRLASHALIAFVVPPNLESLIGNLCSSISFSDQNQLHGTILCLKQIIISYHSYIASCEKRECIINSLNLLQWVATHHNPCCMTQGAALEFCSILIKHKLFKESLTLENNKSRFPLKEMVKLMLVQWNQLYHECTPGIVYALQEGCKFLLASHADENNTAILYLLISHTVPAVRKIGLKEILQRKSIEKAMWEMMFDNICNNIEQSLQPLLFLAVSKNISKFSSLEKSISQLTKPLLHRISFECNEEALSYLIQSSGHIYAFIVNQSNENGINEWLDEMIKLSSYESSSIIRMHVGEALNTFLRSHIGLEKNYTIKIMKILLELLTDDDTQVQEIAAGATNYFLQNSESECNKRPTIGLKDLLKFLVEDGSPSCLGLLIHLALKEEEEDLFGLSQEDDRAFEKGEINIYREEFQMALLIAQIFKDGPTKETSLFEIDCFIKYILCTKTESRSDDFPVSNVYVTRDVMKLLSSDIEFIIKQLETLSEFVPFCIKNFEVWCSRLACRACLWGTLKNIVPSAEPIKFDSIQILNNSIFKPKIIKDVIRWFS